VTQLSVEQKAAVDASGNVLVVAGAGAGKTRTLIQRCLARILDDADPVSVDEILMVTFTQAAGAEMRQRLRAGLENAPVGSTRVAEQLALLETAHISTLHSFCFRLVSPHFYELGLDPRLNVLSEQEAKLLARQTLDTVLDQVYSSETPSAAAIQQLIQAHGGDWDKPIRDAIGRMHDYSQTLRDPEGWLAAQRARFERDDPQEWQEWLIAALKDWRRLWRHILAQQPAANTNAAQCAAALGRLPEDPSRLEFATALAAILEADKAWPSPKGPLREPVKEIFSDTEFYLSLCAAGKRDPLAEDWTWARAPMLALLDATTRFNNAFAQAKRRVGGIDFHDLEQFALKLLWNEGRPSAIAEKWRQKLRLVFVDEFQDINAAQEAIIQALSREGADGNRFLVGDVKQSIYRFRLANPGIFVTYKQEWEKSNGSGTVAGLSENFRSAEGILDFVNDLFASLMREGLGGVPYDNAARLRFGARETRLQFATGAAAPPPVELHLRRTVRGSESDDNDNASDAQKEARMVGQRLLELKGNILILDDDSRRPMRWSDAVILLRSPRGKAAAYAKEFGRLGIPLAAAQGGFYDSAEARDLLALLQLLDNPLQDIPLLGVLLSPIGGLVPADLAAIRIAHRQGRFWTALVDWHRHAEKEPGSPAAKKAGVFLTRFRDWRRLSRRVSVSQCLERIIDETYYADWAATQDRGEQRRANVERFLQLARQFDRAGGESLSRFLRLVEAQQENEIGIEPAPCPETDAVRLMSIHQSKGLEFPVVVVADLGKRFNFEGLWRKILIDEKFGIAPQIKPPDGAQFYPSLPHWLAGRRQKREILAEEMRLLYVAFTRAAQRLILAGTFTKSLEERWRERFGGDMTDANIVGANSYLDWIGSWIARTADPTATGANSLLTWKVYEADTPVLNEIATTVSAAPLDTTPEILERMEWRYPFRAETELPAKASVSLLRRQMADEMDDESAKLFLFDAPSSRCLGTARKLTAAEIGSAHHTFLQFISLDRAQSAAELREQADRLCQNKKLTSTEAACLDFDALAGFWNSAPGRDLLNVSNTIRRELEFTARFSAAELAHLSWKEFAAAGAEEFVIVQGAVDLAAFLPKEIWLLDFKTDQFPPDQLAAKIEAYRSQLALYSTAIERIYARPVTRRWLHFLSHRQTVELPH
jgi:ATP-dependent helicase/nuclease subunit A